MNPDLVKEINKSFVFKAYKALQKISKLAPAFKLCAAVLFFICLSEVVVFGDIDSVLVYCNLVFWIPGILYVFIMGIFHILAGLKIKKLVKKYNIHGSEIKI